jgi:DNA-binding sugar fermentation-stimulating protein
VRPFPEIDPDFAEALASAVEAGVDAHALSLEVEPPAYRLLEPTIPVEPR